MMRWEKSHRCDLKSRLIADRHYNRQHIGAPNFVPPGRCFVLRTFDDSALWITSWPFAEYVRHAWAGAWVNSLFRNEGSFLSSELIIEALSATRWYWPEVPKLGMITFVNSSKIKSTNPGFCYKKAGFHNVGHTQGGLVALQLLEADMPPAKPPFNAQLSLWETS